MSRAAKPGCLQPFVSIVVPSVAQLVIQLCLKTALHELRDILATDFIQNCFDFICSNLFTGSIIELI